MIGVVANTSEQAVIREFFELFKTPWEFYRNDRQYSVLLCSGDCDVNANGASLVLSYHQSEAASDQNGRILSYGGKRLPLYFEAVGFPDGDAGLLSDPASREAMVSASKQKDTAFVRVGYDLFQEVRHLLTIGQSPINAGSPTLDLHVSLLRDLIRSTGTMLVEIPPVPFGYRFAACLTHDIDHPSIRLHRFDHTMLGFLYRAIVGSIVDLLRGRTSVANALRNWLAAAKLPFVYLGFATDFWSDFARYKELEGNAPSSFFAIPYKQTPGRTIDGSASPQRGAGYGVSDIAPQLGRLSEAGCEIGLHGIDAWMDVESARGEINEVRLCVDTPVSGVRMHWLFFNEDSPAVLERAGASYDSTVGFNETIGYRAGTSQVYKPLNTQRLLELPLTIMDTALFYPSYLHLSPEAAWIRISEVIDTAIDQGGCVTVNWHDRSIAPERLWTGTYLALLDELRAKGAWFATASQAVAWFRKRRETSLEGKREEEVETMVPAMAKDALPPLVLRTYRDSLSEPFDVPLGGTIQQSFRHAVVS